MAVVFKFASNIVGLSQKDLPNGVTMVVVPPSLVVSEVNKFASHGKGYVVAFVNRSEIKVRLASGQGSSAFPIERAESLLFYIKEQNTESVVTVQTLVPTLRNGGQLRGEALLTAALENKAAILRALAALRSPARVVPAHTLSEDDEAGWEGADIIPTAEAIVEKVDPMYLWELYMCVLGDQVYPVASFALPEKARRAALTACCFGKTGVEYSVYKSTRLYESVAKLLRFPAIVNRSVQLFIKEENEEPVESFWDNINPVVACLETECPERIVVRGAVAAVPLDLGQMMKGEFDQGVSLYGWRQKVAADARSLTQVASHWVVAVEADIPL